MWFLLSLNLLTNSSHISSSSNDQSTLQTDSKGICGPQIYPNVQYLQQLHTHVHGLMVVIPPTFHLTPYH